MEKSKNSVQSVQKAARLLNILAFQARPLSLGELQKLSGWPKSTIHGLLTALRSENMVEQSADDGRYRLGLRLFEMGCAVSASWDVTGIAQPHMRRLADETGETAYLTRFSAGESVVIDRLESGNAMHVVSAAGTRLPAHCTSQGKVFLAYQSQSELRRLIRDRGLAAYTPHTISTQEELEEECARVRKQGYATEDGEYRIGLRAVSAPIFDVGGRVEYAIGVVGMFRRINTEEFQRATEEVVRAAEEISRELGWRQR